MMYVSGLASPAVGATSVGAVPSMKTSSMPPPPGGARSPVLASMRCTTTPGGCANGLGGVLLSAPIKISVQMGSDARAPCSPRPSSRRSS